MSPDDSSGAVKRSRRYCWGRGDGDECGQQVFTSRLYLTFDDGDGDGAIESITMVLKGEHSLSSH